MSESGSKTNPILKMIRPVSVGDRVICCRSQDQRNDGTPNCGARMVVGRVCYVHDQHMWFGVEFSVGRNKASKIWEHFKFDDFGKAVRPYGK